MFLVYKLCTLVENSNSGIFSDTVNIINVKLCMMVLYIKLLPVHKTFSDLDIILRSQQCQIVLPEKFMFLTDQVETL